MSIAVTRPKAQGYGALLGDEWFRLAPSREAQATIYTRDSLAERQDDTGSAGHNVLEQGYAFGRSNLTGGEGLDWWPRIVGEQGRDTDPIRYWDSANVDIKRPEAGEAYAVTLSKEWADFWTPTDTPADMGASRDAVYIAEGNNVHRFDDWADNTPDDTDALGSADIVNIDVGLDDTVIAVNADGDLYMKPADSDVYVLVYEQGVTDTGQALLAAWWQKGRILAARKDVGSSVYGQLLEISPGIGGTPGAPTSTPIVVVLDTYSGTLNDTIDAGHAIIAAYSDGSIRSYVPQTDSAGGAPELTIRASTHMPTGEQPYALGWNLGTLLILTHSQLPSSSSSSIRAYSALVLDERFDFTVGDMQLLRVWGTSTDAPPAYDKNLVSSRDQIYFTICEGPGIGFSLWRFDLVTSGMFRHRQSACSSGGGLVIFDDRLAQVDGDDILLESGTTFEEDGYLITPNVTFGLNTPINWTSFVLEALNLESAGTKVELYRSIDPVAILDPDHASWILVESFSDPAQSGLELAKINITANQMAMMIRLHRSSAGTAAPDVKRFAVRGLPKHRDWIVDVPINVSDIISAPHRMPLRVPGLGDQLHQQLLSMQGLSTTLRVLDPPITLRGVVDTLMEPVGYITDRGSQGRYCMVRFLGKLVGTDAQAAVQGNEGLGIGTLGIATLGIGEV